MRRLFSGHPVAGKYANGGKSVAFDACHRSGAAIDERGYPAADFVACWRIAGIHADRILCVVGIVP